MAARLGLLLLFLHTQLIDVSRNVVWASIDALFRYVYCVVVSRPHTLNMPLSAALRVCATRERKVVAVSEHIIA